MAYVDPTVACSPWTTPDKLCCEGVDDAIDCDGVSTPRVYEWTDVQIIAAATNLLFRRTCFRYPGICTREVIPCICSLAICVCDKYFCGKYGCRRGEYPLELTSDYPIIEITSIVIKTDGQPDVTLDPSAYRLDENSRVVRIDGERWPYCLTDVHVSYTTGRVPPIELEMAVAELACELKKACNGKDCALPSHVRSLARRGVQMEVWDVAALLQNGVTGNPIIDHALTVHGGPCRKSQMFDPTRSRPEIRVS